MRYYSKDHEWVEVDGTSAIVGITNYAQEQLGDVVFVEVPAVGTAVVAGKESAVVESVKAASEVYAPVSGTVTESNDALADNPALVNASPESDGWFFKLTLSNVGELDGLLDEGGYKEFLETL